MKTNDYSSRAAAKKGATRKGLTIANDDFFKNDNGRWTWKTPEEADAPEVTPEEVDTPEQVAITTITENTRCPHCNIEVIDNGYITNGDEVNNVAITLEKHEFECMACGEEFGPTITKIKGKGIKIQKDRPTQNGVTRPSEGGKCDAIWKVCDRMLSANGFAPTPSLLKEAIAKEEPEANLSNAVAELYQWRRFNGLKGRTVVA